MISAMHLMNSVQGFFAQVAPPPPQAVKTTQIDIGSDIPLNSVDGELFHCHSIVAQNNDTNLVRKVMILAITNSQIVELTPHPTNRNVAHVKDVHELEGLSKIRFKKGVSGVLILEFKSSKISKLVMKDPAGCVEYMKQKMKEVGINGNVIKTSKIERDIANATACFERTKEIELQFSLSPSVELIREMMDLLRTSAEKFGEANDQNYIEVIQYIKKFLQRSDVLSILDEANNHIPTVGIEDFLEQQKQTPATESKQATLQESKSKSTVRRDNDIQFNVSDQNNNTSSSSKQLHIDTTTTTTDTQELISHIISSPLRGNQHTPLLRTPQHSSVSFTQQHEDQHFNNMSETAVSYSVEEDDDHRELSGDRAIPDISLSQIGSNTNKSTEDESCELSAMLDDMTDEFDLLMSSFEHFDVHSSAASVGGMYSGSVSGSASNSVGGGVGGSDSSKPAAAKSAVKATVAEEPIKVSHIEDFDLEEFEKLMEI